MVVSGFLRVVATMVLAYPEYIAKNNGDSTESSSRRPIYIAIHVGLLAIAAVVSIVGSVHGPVSIAVPVQTGSALLFNVIAMGLVLKMRTFDKVQRTGTYVVFFSVLSLIDVGPSTQDGQDVVKLLSHPGAMTWSLFVSAGLIMSTMGTIQLLKGGRANEEDGNSSRHVSIGGDNSILGSNNSILVVGGNNSTTTNNSLGEKEYFLILLVGATLSNVAMATSGKCLGYLTGIQFSIAFLYYVAAALLGLLFSVTSATACDQGIFTPACSVALVIVNWFTGILIWEDWRVMDTWVGYICACLLMCCGVYLLAEIDLLEQYLVRKTTRMVRLVPEDEISQGPLAGPLQETIDELRLVSSCEDTNDEYQFLASGSVGSSF
jgi:hypothetical protein